MKFSIVTPTYNSQMTIRNTLESIIQQTYTNVELVIVDGSSKDNTLDVIKEYSSLFKERILYVSESDNGIYDAMNKGIKMATGDVIGILNLNSAT